jgi:steroid delta-isomerase
VEDLGMAEATALTNEQMRASIDDFFSAASRMDWEAVAARFADDAVVEDPKGSPRHQGRADIQAFYAGLGGLVASIHLEATDVYFSGGGAAAHWTASWTGRNGRSGDFAGIDVYEFDGEGRLTSLLAFWDAESLIAEATAEG